MIWCVEDDASIRDIEVYALTSTGFEARGFADGDTFWDALQKEAPPELVVLDVMLPGTDGIELLRRLRASARFAELPVVMATAKGAEYDKIQGLDLGADYYLTKPFDTRELLACIGALLRRQGAEVNELSYGNTALDLSSGTLVCGEKQLRLSAREFDVMRYLLQMKGQNVSKEAILARVWGFDSNAVENHVEVYVGFLRKKLKSIGSNVRIESARRLGYHLEVAADD